MVPQDGDQPVGGYQAGERVGDCKKPGVYEIEFGTTLQTLMEMVEGRTAKAGTGRRALGRVLARRNSEEG